MKTTKLFTLHDRSIMGYLNYIGIIVFSLIIMLITIFYSNAIPINYLESYTFFSVYFVATANINRCVLPYRRQQPGLVFTSKKLLVRHLYFTTKRGYLLQLTLAFLISLTFVLLGNNYLIIIIAMVAVAISFLAQLMSGFFSIIARLLSLLQIWYIVTSSFEIVVILLFLQALLVYFYISNANRIPLTTGLDFLKNSNKKYKNKNIFYLFLSYINNNKTLMILLGLLTIVIIYFAQSFFTKIEGLPALILIYINFITILEIMIGSKKEEIMIDKARVETIQASLIVKPFERFKSSSIFLLSLVLGFISILGVVGVIINTSDVSIILKNLLSIPLILFIGIVYFRKTELLINGYEYKLLKLSLPILLLICVAIFTITI